MAYNNQQGIARICQRKEALSQQTRNIPPMLAHRLRRWATIGRTSRVCWVLIGCMRITLRYIHVILLSQD